MNSMILSPASSANVIRCRPARVYMGGSRIRHLAVVRWDMLGAPHFGSAELVVHPVNGPAGRIKDAHLLPPIGSEVVICPAELSAGEMIGVVSEHRLQANDTGETLAAIVRHKLAVLLDVPLAAR